MIDACNGCDAVNHDGLDHAGICADCHAPSLAHAECRCDPDCTDCEREIERDESPRGQCYEGRCAHDDCIRQRSEGGMTH